MILLPLALLLQGYLDPEAMHERFLTSSMEKFRQKYSKYDLSKLKKVGDDRDNLYDESTREYSPYIATYTVTDGNRTKKLHFIATCHNSSKITSFLEYVGETDLAIGELPAFNTMFYRKHGYLLPDQEMQFPTQELIRKNVLCDSENVNPEDFDPIQLEKFCTKNNIPLINGEQTLKKTLEDLEDIEGGKEALLALFKVTESENPFSFTTKIILSESDYELLNISINNFDKQYDARLLYKYENTSWCYMRDCHLVTTILDNLENHDEILVLYGAAHFHTTLPVLEQYLGKPIIATYKEIQEVMKQRQSSK